VEETYYVPGGVTRHSTNAFIRLKLGRELSKRRLSSRFAEFRPED
jgi:hypothetical protein